MNKRWYKKKHTYPVVCQWCSSPPETQQKLAENLPRLVFWKKTKLALSHTSMAVWCWCWCVSVAADHFFISYFGIWLEYIFMYWTKLLLLLFYNPFNRDFVWAIINILFTFIRSPTGLHQIRIWLVLVVANCGMSVGIIIIRFWLLLKQEKNRGSSYARTVARLGWARTAIVHSM